MIALPSDTRAPVHTHTHTHTTRKPFSFRFLASAHAPRTMGYFSRPRMMNQNVPFYQKTPFFFECFPCICPEPVLVK